MNRIITPPLVDDIFDRLVSFDIEMLLRRHPYDPARLEPAYKNLDKEIREFDPLPKNEEDSLPFGGRVIQSYGEYLEDHLEWTSQTLNKFLMFMGYDEDIASRVAQAFKRHDIGKAEMPGQWKRTEGKQNISDKEKADRTRMHCILGAQRIHKEIETSAPGITDSEIIGFTVAEHMAMFHHERLDGSGPFKRMAEDMCLILRAATIVDTFHGKLKGGKNADQICDEMASEKHEGEFDNVLLTRFGAFLNSFAPAMRRDLLLQP